jgi:hypothetical protein
MPQNSQGLIAVWQSATAVASVGLSVQNAGVLLRRIPSSGTAVDLPDLPNDGDAYDVIDADGSCNTGHEIAIVPAGVGVSVRGGASLVLSVPFVACRLIFDAQSKDWTVTIASSAGTLPPAPGTPAYNPAWYAAADIYLDPQNSSGTASDDNLGTSQATALLTYEEIERRYGGPTARITQPTTIHLMSSQTLNVDPIFFNGEGASTGAIGAQMILDGTLGRTVIANTALGAVTPKVRANPGNDLQVAGMPAGAAAHQLIVNNTRNSAAFIVSVAAGVATMTQPIPLSVLTTPSDGPWSEDNTWTVGDQITIYTLPLVNLKQWELRGGDTATGNVGCGTWVQFVQVADPTGSAGTVLPIQAGAVFVGYSACYIGPRPHTAQIGGRGGGIFFNGCDIAGQYSVFSGTAVAYGGILRAGCAMYSATALIVNSNLGTLAGDIIIVGAAQFSNWVQLGFIHLETSLAVLGGAWQTAGTQVWGAGTVTVWPASTWYNGSGNSFAASLTVGQLAFAQLNGGTKTTGSSYVGVGVFVDGIALTPANIDAGGAYGPGLFSPTTGARFCSAA